ncbi:MAG: PAC2 family protein [Nitrososphaerales archaeon]|jgi:uncharacterized protein
MSEAHPGVEIRDSGPHVSKPRIVVGVPEAGLVGTIACSYLIEELKMVRRGFVDSELLPQVMLVHDSAATYPIHIFGKDDLLVVLSEIPLPPFASAEVAKALASWARSLRAELVIGVTGAPSKSRDESQGEGKPTVVGVGNSEAALAVLKSSGAASFEDGIITGFYASLVKHCNAIGQNSVTLLAESLSQFPDPAAAVSAIDVLGKVLSLQLDTQALMKESEEIRLRSRELMQQTQQASQPGGQQPTAYR